MTDAAGKRTSISRWPQPESVAHDGRLLEERGLMPDGAADTNLSYWAYDAEDGKYHHWHFDVFGSPAISQLEWDESARTLVGNGKLSTGEQSTTRVQLADPDLIQWTLTPEVAGGKALASTAASSGLRTERKAC